MSSKTEIFNEALAIIGGPSESVLVEDADADGSEQSQWLKSFWKPSLEFCAVDIEAREFRKYAELAQTGDTVESLDWEYVFDRPADCLSVINMTDDGDHTQSYEFQEFGQYFLTNVSDPYLEYISIPHADNTQLFSRSFSSLVAARLAVMICGVWKKENLPIAIARYDAAANEALDHNAKGLYQEETKLWTEIS